MPNCVFMKFQWLNLASRKFEGKMQGKENREVKGKKKMKGKKFEVDKLFLYAILNSFHLF